MDDPLRHHLAKCEAMSARELAAYLKSMQRWPAGWEGPTRAMLLAKQTGRLDRLARLLWRDTGQPDEIGGEIVGHHYSLLGRFRICLANLCRFLGEREHWLAPAIISAIVSISAIYLASHLQSAEADKKVDAALRELRLKCADQGNGILTCRKSP